MNIPKTITVFLLSVAVALFAASLYVQQSQEELALSMQVKILEQEKTLRTIAELTNENRADSVTESIMRDCSPANRTRYNELLDRLAVLDQASLTELDQLFDACASFFAERKAIMASRLQREYEVYRDYVSLYDQLDGRGSVVQYPVSTWKEVTELELERGTLLSEQVDIQANIIADLRARSTDQDRLESLLVRSQQITNQVATINKQINELQAVLQDV